MANQQPCLDLISDRQSNRAVVFLHGFSGDREGTWGKLPLLVGNAIADVDILTLGYSSTFYPDIAGIWSADADLPTLAIQYRTQLGIPPLRRYDALSIVAHSMGGLIAQRALLDDPELRERMLHLILFGTPSGGLKKASWFKFWKRQINNMVVDSPFIRALREDWTHTFPDKPTFTLLTVAGSKDQFVPPRSSLEPFDARYQRVVEGDHLAIVKPRDMNSDSVRLLVSALAGNTPPADSAQELKRAAEVPSKRVGALIEEQGTLTETQVVEAALALDLAGRRAESIALLQKNLALGTDVQGVLAGRFKRIWLEEESRSHAERSFELYEGALKVARARGEPHQIYYHAINLAFIEHVVHSKADSAAEFAEEARAHAERCEPDFWSLATRAEAQLYLGDIAAAVGLYQEAAEHARKVGTPSWQLVSTSQQAFHVARALDDQGLASELDAIFSLGGKPVFISYSHRDKAWLERLKTMMTPYFRDSEIELWDDTLLQAGDKWRDQIERAMRVAGVAVVLGSANFLASEFITTEELPVIVRGADEDRLRLVWVALEPAGYEVTRLHDFQCANNPNAPLSGMSDHDQKAALLEIARKIKRAALGDARLDS